MTLVDGLVAVIDGACAAVGAIHWRAGGAAVRPVIEERALVWVAELPGANLIAVAKRPVAANRRVRLESARVEQADVARAEVQVLALRRVQAHYALVGGRVAIARAAVAGAAWTIGGGRARLQVFRSTHALLADRRCSDDAQVVHARFGAVAELAIVAVCINLALHARGPRIVAITQAMSARSAIHVGRTGGTGREPHEARFGARHRRAGLAKAGG